MAFQAIFGLIVMAVQLLVSASQPGVSPEQKQVAIDTANTSISAAVEYLKVLRTTPTSTTNGGTGAGNGTDTGISTVVIPPVSSSTPPIATSTPPVPPVPAYSIKVLQNTLTKDGGDVQFQILDANGKPVKSSSTIYGNVAYIQYDLLKFNGSNRPYTNTNACQKAVEQDSYFLNFKGLTNDSKVSIDADNNLTLHVEWCGNTAESKVKIVE